MPSISILNADLPSEDEEDEDFELEEDKKAARKRERGLGALSEAQEEATAELTAVPARKSEAKRAKVDALWQQLNRGATPGSKPGKPALKQPAKLAKASADQARMFMGAIGAPYVSAPTCLQAWMKLLGPASKKAQPKDSKAKPKNSEPLRTADKVRETCVYTTRKQAW